MTLDLPSIDEKEFKLDQSWATNLVKTIQNKNETSRSEKDNTSKQYIPLFSQKKGGNYEENHSSSDRKRKHETDEGQDEGENEDPSKTNKKRKIKKDISANNTSESDRDKDKEKKRRKEKEKQLNHVETDTSNHVKQKEKRKETENEKEAINNIKVKRNKPDLPSESENDGTGIVPSDVSNGNDSRGEPRERKMSRKKQKELLEKEKKKEKRLAARDKKRVEKEEQNNDPNGIDNEEESEATPSKESYEVVHVYSKKKKEAPLQRTKGPRINIREMDEVMQSKKRIDEYMQKIALAIEKETENDGDDESEPDDRDKPTFGTLKYTDESEIPRLKPKKHRDQIMTLDEKIAKAERKDKYLSEDTKHAENLREVHRWKRAMDKEKGVNVFKQSTDYLKQAQKQVQKRKEKSKREWEERVKSKEEAQQIKQKKRAHNLKLRKQANLESKIYRRFKVKPSKSKKRPGFEGRKRGFINK